MLPAPCTFSETANHSVNMSSFKDAVGPDFASSYLLRLLISLHLVSTLFQYHKISNCPWSPPYRVGNGPSAEIDHLQLSLWKSDVQLSCPSIPKVPLPCFPRGNRINFGTIHAPTTQKKAFHSNVNVEVDYLSNDLDVNIQTRWAKNILINPHPQDICLAKGLEKTDKGDGKEQKPSVHKECDKKPPPKSSTLWRLYTSCDFLIKKSCKCCTDYPAGS